MRPLTLEVAGFTTFREQTVVDFDGVDYFALVGPTGSGKSSIIDAICFALYGKIPRLPQSSVEPVISQGKQEARIRLDFVIGETRYTAARVVRRIAGGASTKEARLERGDEVLAGDADGVSSEVERLLGLGFAQFTRCVVLPQGEFARFMHDKPADRQDLLVKLLDLAMYGRMAQRANQRASVAEIELNLHRAKLEQELSFATPDALETARARLATLHELRDRIDADEPVLEQLRETVRTTREAAAQARGAAELLGRIKPKEGIQQLAQLASDAQNAVRVADERAERAAEAMKAADASLASLPARHVLEAALSAHEQRATLSAELEVARARLDSLAAAATDAAKAAEAAEAVAHDAQHTLEAARVQHAAADLAQMLATGEPCPVCRQDVHEMPEFDVPADFDAAKDAADAATRGHKEAERARVEAERAVTGASARADALAKQLADLDASLAEHPEAAAVRARLDEVAVAEKLLAETRAEADAANAHAKRTRSLAKEAEATIADARAELTATRDTIAHLSPPPLRHEDLAADWTALVAWAQEEQQRQRAEADAADARVSDASDRGSAIRVEQRARCADAGIEEEGSPRDDCLKAIERQIATTERIEIALEEAEKVRAEVAALEERHAVAKEVGKHLKANAFERWVLRQALTSLADGATEILHNLSGGQYSLTLDKSFGFAVIDHRNANATRSAKTLSGGETFLASLALALAMSDRIAQLSANTAVRLESIFLDEGFGTLDPETLEVVATAIESLGASNRVVGIVTHVRDLAERVPVRFEVRKGASTSTVEKVLA